MKRRRAINLTINIYCLLFSRMHRKKNNCDIIYYTTDIYIHTYIHISYLAIVSKTQYCSNNSSDMDVLMLYLYVKKKYDSSDILALLDRDALFYSYKCQQIWVFPYNQTVSVVKVCSLFPLTLNNVISTEVINNCYFYKIRFDDTNTLNYSSIQQQHPKEFLRQLLDKLTELKVVYMTVDTVQDFLNLTKHW
jgi:hypothetical protein